MFLEIIKSILFGIVQGITEWLPISSTGHLIIFETLMPMNVFDDPAANVAFWDMYKVVIQFGSILAVLVLYFEKLNPFSKKKDEKAKRRTWRLWILIVISMIPAGIAGVLLDDIVDEKLSTPVVIAIALIVYGILFIVMKQDGSNAKVKSINKITPKLALQVGLFQALALIPGTSRSGSTILGATLLGLSRNVATEFSFFMAIPVMAGASLLKLRKLDISMGANGLIILLIGMIVSFVVSIFVIRNLLAYIRKHDFKVFGYYRIILGVLLLVLSFFGVLPSVVG